MLEDSCCLRERKDGVWELGAQGTGRFFGNEIVRTWRLMRWHC